MTTTETTPNRELDALIAIHVFGWRWMRNTHVGKCALIAPETSAEEALEGWKASNWCAAEWEPCEGIPAQVERDRGWARICSEYRGGELLRTGLPRYSEDIAAAWKIVTEMRKRGGTLMLVEHIRLPRWEADFGMGGVYNPAQDESECVALCRAALASLGGGRR